MTISEDLLNIIGVKADDCTGAVIRLTPTTATVDATYIIRNVKGEIEAGEDGLKKKVRRFQVIEDTVLR